MLLGYTQQSASLEGSVCRLRDLRIQKDYAAAFREAEKALQRFPNNFQVVYECARIYQLSGLENRDTAALARCQELYRRSLELISQNEDREISPVSIYIAIANAMHSAGDKEGALKLLKEYNVEGVNNAEIGTILAKEQETSQESPHLSHPGFAERGNRHASVQRGLRQRLPALEPARPVSGVQPAAVPVHPGV